MKKFLKGILVFLLIIVLVLGGFLFVFRHRVNLYVNIGKQYLKIKDNPPSSTDVSSLLTPMESMDFKDIVYKDTNGVPLTLDIYGPRKKLSNGSPVILYVHGGSWVYGDKSIPQAISPLFDSFRDEGFTIISTSYELIRKTVNFDKQASDVKDTLRWIYKNKDVYGFNTDEIGVIGTSSGAHLSMLAAYSSDEDFKGDTALSNYPSDVKYVIDFFGPTDLTSLDMRTAGWDLDNAIKATKNTQEMMRKYSPINYLKEGLPETLIVHSKKDEVVPFSNSTLLYEKSKEYNNKVELLTLENSGHDLSDINRDDVISLATKVLQFIVKNSPL